MSQKAHENSFNLVPGALAVDRRRNQIKPQIAK